MDITQLTPNQTIQETFAVISVQEKTTRKGDPYLIVELAHPTGTIEAKVWSNALNACTLERKTTVDINARVDEYQGKKSLVIQRAEQIQETSFDKLLPTEVVTPTLIFDIETVGKSFEELDKDEQHYLLNNLEKNEEDKKVAKQKTGLHPLFGFVSHIGMINPNTQKGIVLGIEALDITPEDTNFKYHGYKTEKELLEKFWEIANKYQRFVTYNGTRFDFPFLLFRSGVNRVEVPFELHRYSEQQHIDLQKKFQGTRSYKLEFIAKAMNVSNPKDQGVSGLHVAELFRKQKYQNIVDYVARDAVSTMQLYNIWKQYLAGKIVL